MPDRLVKIVKAVCLILAVLLALRIAAMAPRLNPLAHVVIPQLPTLAAATNDAAAAGKTTNLVAGKNTNGIGTNAIAKHSHGNSNVVAAVTNAGATTNSGIITNAIGDTTGAIAGTETNQTTNAATAITTNAAAGAMMGNRLTNVVMKGSNALMASNGMTGGTNVAGTNLAGTNLMAMGGTNRARGRNASGSGNMMMAGMGGMGGMGAPPTPLPPEIKARIDKIYESEIFGPVMHPIPPGLMGIAGDYAFLRTGSGQTGMVKEGDSLGELKLVKIGINRVLVDDGGEKKEFMIFEGLGGKSLLTENKTNENAK